MPLLCSTLHCCQPLYSPWLDITEPPPCRPAGPKGAPWRHTPPASSSSPCHRLLKPSNRRSRADVFLHEELTIDRHGPSTSSLTTTSRRTTQVHSSTTSTPSQPATSGLSCRHHPTLSSSLTTARQLWWVPFHPNATHGFPVVHSSSPAPPCLPLATDWPESVGWAAPVKGGGEGSPVSALGEKAHVGWVIMSRHAMAKWA
jgi:hypothetical protein